jgi:nitroreductase
MTSDLDHFSALVRRRRTNMRIDSDRAVDPALITQLCELATWAPNHKLTEPWRFAVVTGSARADLGTLAAEYQAAQGETNEAKLNKTRGKFLRSPVVTMIASAWSDPLRRDEDRDAVSAGVQNLLLAATAAGLASYWGTGAVCMAPEIKQLCGFPTTADVLAAVYLGWPIGEVPTPPRAAPVIRWVM